MHQNTGRPQVGVSSLTSSAGQGAIAPTKWQLLTLVERTRETLALKGTSISLLRAMLSLLPTDQISNERDDFHICFASNATLAQRAHVSIQTVERHISHLVAVGLVERLSSANGKRWARRDQAGRIIVAAGISVLPLQERADELARMAREVEEKDALLKTLRAKCAALVARIKRANRTCEQISDLLTDAARTLRRKLEHSNLVTLLMRLTQAVHNLLEKSSSTNELRDTNSQTEGHKETPLNRSVEDTDTNAEEITPAAMERSYPKLCAYLRTARTGRECQWRMDRAAAELGLGPMWANICHLGPRVQFMILGYLYERVDRINSPKAYAGYLIKKLKSNDLFLRQLLVEPARHRRAVSTA